MDLRWKQTRVGERWADICYCAACKHIHKMESWLVPLRALNPGRCVNCGGDLRREKGKDPACGRCGLTEPECRDLHGRLAQVHPSQDFQAAALAAAERSRHVLALKLASAASRWGRDDDAARRARVNALQALGLTDRALDEAWEWAHRGAPHDVWSLLAGLEAGVGNVDGALRALEYGLEADPAAKGMWMDYAELLAHVDQRQSAAHAAMNALEDEALRARAMQVIADVALRNYDEKLYVDALSICSALGDFQRLDARITWLRARVAAQQDDRDGAMRWLRLTLDLDPDHAEAQTALDRIEPRARKKGWFPWNG
jgi:tetratricopeptide (TPR) repeat protein